MLEAYGYPITISPIEWGWMPSATTKMSLVYQAFLKSEPDVLTSGGENNLI